MTSMISKNYLDFGGDPDHVTLDLGLQLPWRRIALCECFLYFKPATLPHYLVKYKISKIAKLWRNSSLHI